MQRGNQRVVELNVAAAAFAADRPPVPPSDDSVAAYLARAAAEST